MGEKKSGSDLPMKFYALMAKVDADNKPYFRKSEKVDNAYKETGQFDGLTGMITGAKIEERQFDDGKKKFFVLYLTDEEAVRKVQMSYNQIAYSIINSLAGSIDTISDFAISVYRKQSEDGKYWNGRAKVLRAGQKTEWNHNPKDAPQRELITKKDGVTPILKEGKKQYDDTDVRKFYEDLFIDKIVSLVGKKTPEPTSEGTGTNSSTQEDDLPF